jgi:hypothetical protein
MLHEPLIDTKMMPNDSSLTFPATEQPKITTLAVLK